MMRRRHRVLVAALGLTILFLVVASACAQLTPPKLSDEEIQKITDAVADAPAAKLAPQPQPALPPPKP